MNESSPVPPIIVFDETSVPLVFDSVREAAGYMEAIDIDLYTVYDSTGQLLNLVAKSSLVVAISVGQPATWEVDELRARLMRSLEVVGQPADANATLGDLIAVAQQQFRYLPFELSGCVPSPFRSLARWVRGALSSQARP